MMQPYLLLPSEDRNLDLQPDPTSHAESRSSSVLMGKRIVIVEDEGITQMLLRRMLKKAGLMVLASAVNGKEGVEAVLRERPDLVLMDIRMPGPFDGLEAAQRILSEYHVCIVMLTAFSDEEYKNRAMGLNACGYVVKPVTSESLLPQLEAAYRGFNQC